MARSRNIKPSFFFNEDLVELDFEYRLMFIGMWTLADREGRIENRPKKIKMNLFPADEVDIDKGLKQLEKYGFIEMYSANNVDVINITNFLKHQSPHGLEKDSELPDKNGFYTVYKRTKSKTITGKPLLVDKNSDSTNTDNDTKTVIEPLDNSYSSNDDVNSDDGDKSNEPLEPIKTKGCNDKQLDNGYETVINPSRNALIPDSLIPDSLIPETINNNNNARENFNSIASWEPNFDDIAKIVRWENSNLPPLTEPIFKSNLRKFKAEHIERESRGEFIQTDEKRIDMLVGWMLRAMTYQQKSKQDTINAATGEVDQIDWSQVGRKAQTDMTSDVPTGFHPSHTSVPDTPEQAPETLIYFTPQQFGGTGYPLFEGMSLGETQAHVVQNIQGGETQEDCYLRLSGVMG